MIKLRDYQEGSIKELRQGFKTHQRQVLALPTGAGKTVIFSEMVRLASLKNTVTLVLTDRVELFEQTFKSINSRGVKVERINANTKNPNTDATIFVAMVETLARRNYDIKPTLLVLDEAHMGNFNKIIDKYPDARVIGVTATPIGKQFFKYYTNIVQPIDTPELVKSGYLVPCKAYQMQDDLSDLEVVAGEYSDKSQFQHYNKASLYSGVVSTWQQRTPGKKTLVFCVNIEHAEKTAATFLSAGIRAGVVTSKTSNEDRASMLWAFKHGHITVLVNCGILTKGYDEPSIEVIILNRATTSLALYLQMSGRGSRLHPGKKFFTMLDFGLNHNRHDLWNVARVWELEPPKKKRSKLGAAPVRECKECGAMLPASSRSCEYCGHEVPLEKLKLKSGYLVEVKPKEATEGLTLSQLSIDELIVKQANKEVTAALTWRIVRSRGLEEVKKYARRMGYHNGWVAIQEEQLNDVKFNDYAI